MANRGIDRLISLQKYPRAWAYTREAFCVLIGIAFEEAGKEQPHLLAVEVCFGNSSSCSVDSLIQAVTEDWATTVIDKALKKI